MNHDGPFELYNLEEDPMESNNIFEEEKESDIVHEMLEARESYKANIDC